MILGHLKDAGSGLDFFHFSPLKSLVRMASANRLFAALGMASCLLEDDFVEWVFHDAGGPCGFQARDDFADGGFFKDGVDGYPGRVA